ncbi:MAG: hypothetical protein NVS1B13_15360 [Flavisolibacter sp.]
MSLEHKDIKPSLRKKFVTLVLISASFAAFASLGDGGRKNFNLSYSLHSKSFSLRSGYNYRTNRLFSPSTTGRNAVTNTFVSFQKGNATYILPLKKKIFSDKIKFSPTQPRF